MNLDGQVAVVTGAGSGIGLGAAAAFRARGATVLAADLDPTAAEALDGVVGIEADVRSDADMARVAEAAAELGPVGVVMANAGIAAGGRVENVPIEEWHRLLDLNVLGVVRTIQPHLPAMRDRGDGYLVVTGSSAGLFTDPTGGNAPYATTKAALLGLARNLAKQVDGDGLAVHYLAPRLTDTPFPVSAVAWGRSGARTMSDRPVEGADTVDQVIDALLDGMAQRRFLISLTPDTEEQLTAFARSEEP
ncbi:MAG: SDR family oxidoreductase [Actinomycetota bacterium]